LRFLLAAAMPAATDFYVSPAGNDGNPGSAARPFRTLERARQAARKAQKNAPVHVYLRAGKYRVSEPLVFGPEDSGDDGAPVVWAAVPGAQASIAGSRKLDLKWSAYRDGILKAAVPAGLDVGVDLASRDRATVGGMVATNAGGLRVLRHGHVRGHLAGVEAVLADGRVLRRMAGLKKDTAGYDLTGLLCGSEGTLAVVTAALLRLVPLDADRVTALLGVGSVGDALAVVRRLRAGVGGVESAEIMFPEGVALLEDLLGLRSPLGRDCPAQLLVDIAAADPDPVLSVLAACPEITDSAVSADGPGRARLWALRERHPDLVARLGVPHKLDVAVPLGALADFEVEVRAALARLPVTVVLYGHVGDGSLHVNVATPAPGAGEVEDAVFGVVQRFGGTISAEHGIGTDKVRWLDRARSPEEIDAMRALKAALDPGGVLNPGVLLPRP